MTSIEAQVQQPYKYGFVTDIDADAVPPGLNEDVERRISQKKGEPDFLLDWRLKAFRHWVTMKEPRWANVKFDPIDYQSIVYYSAPKSCKKVESLDAVDPKLLETFERLGIPISEQKRLAGVAVDAAAGGIPGVGAGGFDEVDSSGSGLIGAAVNDGVGEGHGVLGNGRDRRSDGDVEVSIAGGEGVDGGGGRRPEKDQDREQD